MNKILSPGGFDSGLQKEQCNSNQQSGPSSSQRSRKEELHNDRMAQNTRSDQTNDYTRSNDFLSRNNIRPSLCIYSSLRSIQREDDFDGESEGVTLYEKIRPAPRNNRAAITIGTSAPELYVAIHMSATRVDNTTLPKIALPKSSLLHQQTNQERKID